MKSSAAHVDNLPQCEIQGAAKRFAAALGRSGRPVLLTHAGKRTGVAMGISKYQSLIDEIETLKDLRTALAQVSRGKTDSHAAVSRRLQKRLDDAY